jgi:hypothetical protein
LVGSLGSAAAMISMRSMRKDVHFSLQPFWFSMGVAFTCPLFSLNHLRTQSTTTTYTLELGVLILTVAFALFFG